MTSQMKAPVANVKDKIKEHVTPFKVALIIIVEEYLVNDRKPVFERERYTEKEEREMLLFLLQLVQSADLELKDLMFSISQLSKPQLLESVTKRLEELEDEGVCGVMDLISGSGDALFEATEEHVQPLMHRSSVIGLFVRRMTLAFEVLTFQEVTRIFTAFKAYLTAWRKTDANASESADALDGSNNTSQMNEDISMSMSMDDDLNLTENKSMYPSPKPRPVESKNRTHMTRSSIQAPISRHSQKLAELFIAQQTNLLQCDESQAMTPKQLQARISELLTNNPNMAEVHYLSYLNNLRVNEYCSALESLYHYFDKQHTLPGSANQNAANKNKNDQSEETTSRGFRYAALNLASLQYRFGHRSEALAATQEAIRVAQEAGDNVCLQHALTWLHRLGVQQSGSTSYILDRLVFNSADSNLPYLMSLGIQAFAKHNAVSTAEPSSIFKFLLKSDMLNAQHSQSDLLCVSYAQKAALWHMYGMREMCSVNSQIMLNLNTTEQGLFHNAEPECLGLCHLANAHSDKGEYESAFEIILCTKLRFPTNSKFCTLWMQQEHLLNFRRAMHHGNHNMAVQAIFNLASVNPSEASLCRCILTRDKGETTQAFTALQSLLEQCQGHKNKPIQQPHFYARLLLLKGELLYSVGDTAGAIEPLLTCVTLCERHHLSYLHTLASLHIAFVQYLLNLPQQALRVLEGVLLHVYSHSSLYDRGRAQLLWVKCKVACAKYRTDSEKQTILSACVRTLDDVISLFKTVEAHRRHKDAIYLQARLYHAIGCTSERNRCAMKFKELDQLYPSFHATNVCVL